MIEELKMVREKRTFILGDEWFYCKIFTGVKVANSLLINQIYLLAESWKEKGIIDKWFFIRYTDPKFHLRVRFKITDQIFFNTIIFDLNEIVSILFEQKIIYKFQTDSYVRELERYSLGKFDNIETIFYYDSVTVINALKIIEDSNSTSESWKFGLLLIDNYLDLFCITLSEKHLMMEKFVQAFSDEMNYNKTLKKQLNIKYRNLKPDIEELLSCGYKNSIFQSTINYRNDHLKGIVIELLNNSNNSAILPEFIFSLCHMSLNRLYSSRSRENEFVSYYLLSSYYRSQIAQKK